MEKTSKFWTLKGSTEAMASFGHEVTNKQKGYYGDYGDDFDSKDKDEEEMEKRGKPVH